MKILLVTPYFLEPKRGVASAQKAAFALARSGREVVVFTSGSAGSWAAPSVEEVEPRLKVYRHRDVFLKDPANFGILPFLGLRLASVLRRERPTHVLVYKHMFYTSLAVPWLKLARRRVVLVTDTFPGVIWFSRSRGVNAVLWTYARTLGRLVLKLADHVVLLHAGLGEAAQKLGLKHVSVIPNGVDLQAIESARGDLLKKKRGELIVTYVGRLESVKGVEVLLDAANEIVQRRPDVRFVLIGDRAAGSELVARYASERIQFLGYRSDVMDLLRESDVFVLPSYAEGLPNALMEAMAAGCAAVASRVGGVVELLGDDEAGLTVPPGEPAALREAIERLLDDPELRSRLGSEARRVIETRFRLEQTTERLCELLEAVARR